jgi:hypothetical protein
MSQQQEFQPQEYGKQSQSQSEEEVYRQARTKSQQRRTGAMPKEEHPSTFDESIPPYSYRAQDTARPQQKQEARQENRENREPRMRRQGFSPDGDKFETGYRPYQNMWQWQAPHWARPQPRARGLSRTIFFVILALLLLPIMLKVLLILLSIVAIFAFGFVFFAFVVLGIGAIVFFALRRSLGWPRRTSWHW